MAGLTGFLGGLGTAINAGNQQQQQALQLQQLRQQMAQAQAQQAMQQQAAQRAQQQAAATAFAMAPGGPGALPGAMAQGPQAPPPGQSSAPQAGPNQSPAPWAQQPQQPQGPTSPYSVKPMGPGISPPPQAPQQAQPTPIPQQPQQPAILPPQLLMASIMKQFPGIDPQAAIGAVQTAMQLQEPVVKLLQEKQDKDARLALDARKLQQQAQDRALDREARADNARAMADLRREALESNNAYREAMLALSGKREQDKIDAKPKLSNDAVDMAAQLYIANGGKMPAIGTASAEAREKILDRAAELQKTKGGNAGDILEAGSSLHADTGSLASLQKTGDSINSVEKLVKGNMGQIDRMLTAGKGAGSPYGPVFNKWLQAGRQATGDPDVRAFNGVVTETANELGRLLSGGRVEDHLTDAARKQGQEILSSIDSPETLRNVFAAQLETMNRRKLTNQQQIDAIKRRLGGKPAADDAPAAPSGDPGEKYDHLFEKPPQ